MTRATGNYKGKAKAVLLEVDGDFGFALTPDGRFVSVRCRPGDEEGREVDLDRAQDAKRTAPWAFGRGRRPAWALRPRLAAGLVVVLCFVILSPFAVGRVLASGSPVAYVSVDVNSSLEFGVNRWDRTVTARGLDSGGEALLGQLQWRGQPVADVVAAVGSVAAAQGLLGGGQRELLVAAVPAKAGRTVPPGLERQLASVCETLDTTLGAGATGDPAPEVTVESLVADAANLRDQAAKLGLSVGEYAVLLAAQEAGLDIDRDDLDDGLGQAIIAAGGQPGEVIREAHGNRELSKLAKKFGKRNGVDSDDEDKSSRSEGGEGQATGTEGGENGTEPGGDATGSGGKQGGQGRGQGNGHGTPGVGSDDGGSRRGGSGPGRHPGNSTGHGRDGGPASDRDGGEDGGSNDDGRKPKDRATGDPDGDSQGGGQGDGNPDGGG